MDREIVLLVLALLAVGIALPIGALVAALWDVPDDPGRPGLDLHRRATRRLLLPVVPAAVVLATLPGWAFMEPEDAERVPWTAFALAAPALFVGLRAAARAVRALRTGRVRTAATVGLIHPRVVLDEDFAVQLDEGARRAALAHEGIHAAHADPLRIWLAQLVTDLQRPFPGAGTRFEWWLLTLELARDEEARRDVAGADLAAAIVAAARIEAPSPFACAGIASSAAALRLRVERLLAPVPEALGVSPARGMHLLLVVALVASSVLGAVFGEALVRQVLGWGR